MSKLLFCTQGMPRGWMGMGSLAPAWDLHPARPWGSAGKRNAANGMCAGAGGTPPPPLLPKTSDGAREVYTRKGWFGAQCSFSGFSISFTGGRGGGHLGPDWG